MDLKNLIEALIFSAGRPIKVGELLDIIEAAPDRIEAKRPDIEEAIQTLNEEWEGRGGQIRLTKIADGFEFRTEATASPWLKLLTPLKPQRLSKRSFETLALIAYRQPITRVDIEGLRGVDSAAILKNLLEKGLIRVVGRKEEAGRPLLYATSKVFLELFSLKNLNDLPPLSELEERVKKMPDAPDEDLNIADLALTPEDLSDLDDKDKEVLGELEDRLKELKTTEKEALRLSEEAKKEEKGETTVTADSPEAHLDKKTGAS